LVTIFWIIQKTNWQYYYYDSWTSTYPYQQWCSENLNVRVNTQNTPVVAGRFHLILDPSKISYATTSDYNILRNNLFVKSNEIFANRSSSSSPSWKSWSNNTILQSDLSNTLTTYNWNGWLYWTIKFIPLYNTSPFNWSFGMEFNPIANWCDSSATIETTLSAGWCDVINIIQQALHLTWTYNFIQEPCVSDTNNPSISITTPLQQPKQSSLSWISLSLNEAAWVNWTWNVPYIRTWWGLWTWNPSWVISNQYWINLNSFNLIINWNSQTKTFTWWSLWITITWNGKTREYYDKNYNITINPAQLFSYWIEKTITITTNIADRKWNAANQSVISFNSPIWPRLLWTPSPNNGAIFVNLAAAINLGIQDDRAWVDSWSIIIILSWINWTNYWPYIFSWSNLNLSWIASTANQPNYSISINHSDFPASWNIRVSVYAEDMENNIDTISDYSFSTRPSCTELQCCEVTIITRSWEIFYNKDKLYISWYNSPIFYTWVDWSWYIDCKSQNVWLKIYDWDWASSWSASILSSYYDKENLILSWRNWIKAVLSWDTIYLSIINLFWYRLTWAILFTGRELSTWTVVWPEDVDITTNNSFDTWIVMQSTWNMLAPEIIEAYFPPNITIVQTWAVCSLRVLQRPILTWKANAEASLPNEDIYTVFKIWFTCLWSEAKFYDTSWSIKEIELRIKDPNLIENWTTKVRYSNDLINRNAMWIANVVNHIATFKSTHFTYFALWNDKPIRDKPPTWWGWWWGALTKDYCPDWDYSDSYYDKDCWLPNDHEIVNYCWVWETKYSYERVNAFQYAYWLWITTMCPIEDARLGWYILRKELAKMISEFSIKVVWLYPNFSKTECDDYGDIWKESKELQFYMKLSCRLWLMWLHTDWITVKDNFDPNDYVDRAQFWTIMSRLIFWGKYNWNEDNRYIDHLKALKQYQIMKYIEKPAMKELRWYVMIMMQRADESWIIKQMRAATDLINWANNLRWIDLYNPQ